MPCYMQSSSLPERGNDAEGLTGPFLQTERTLKKFENTLIVLSNRMKVHSFNFQAVYPCNGKRYKKSARQSLDRAFTLILISKPSSNFTPTVLNLTRKKGPNHLFSGSRTATHTCGYM